MVNRGEKSWWIVLNKAFFQPKILIFVFLFFDENICCGTRCFLRVPITYAVMEISENNYLDTPFIDLEFWISIWKRAKIRFPTSRLLVDDQLVIQTRWSTFLADFKQYTNAYVCFQETNKRRILLQRFTRSSLGLVYSNDWHIKKVDIPAQTYDFTIIIEGIRGAGSYGDAAVDDISVRSGVCP